MNVQTQIQELFTAAFKEPIVASKMIGFRFTVGGGKKVRQKYGDDMPKYCRYSCRKRQPVPKTARTFCCYIVRGSGVVPISGMSFESRGGLT